MWKYKRENQEKAFQARNTGNIAKKPFENVKVSYKIQKEENLTKRNPVTCCFPIQPKRDPGDDDQKDTWAVHL